jgi:hypothetical protein
MKTDALIKKLECFRIDGFVLKLLSVGVSDWVYSGWLADNVIYGSEEDFCDEIDPELLKIIHKEREGQEELKFQRAMSMVIIRRVLEKGLMTIGDEPWFGEDFTPWPLSVDDSVQRAYDRWEKEFAHPDDLNDLYLLYNTDLGNEMGKKAICKIARRDIAASEKNIELESDSIKHYIEHGYLYWHLANYESDPIKEAEYRKNAWEDAETIRKLNPDDIRHNKHDRVLTYRFFSDIEPDAVKAQEYTNKANEIDGVSIDPEAQKKVCEDSNTVIKLALQKTFGEQYENLLKTGFFEKYFLDMPASFNNAIGINPKITEELFTKPMKEAISEMKKEIKG